MKLTPGKTMKPAPNLILLNQTPRWAAAIRRRGFTFEGLDCRITWAVDLDDLIHEARRRPGSAALVELDSGLVAEQCADFAVNANSDTRLLLVAAGNYKLRPWLPLLRVSGFADVILSLNEIERFRIIAFRHFSRCGQTSESRSLEESIKLELPWKPVTG